MKWRFISLDEGPAAMNMAIDEAVLEGISKGTSPPTVRFYRWKPSAVSLGRFQRVNEVVNLAKCRELGVDVVRRITGGGAVYHDYYGEITYSVLAREKLLPGDITQSYHEICGWIINSLTALGLDAEFQPVNDILVDGKKISGNAQTRRKGVVLQHGTILYDFKPEIMFAVLKITKEKISDKMIKAVEERVTSITRLTDSSFDELAHALWEGFSKGKEIYAGELDDEEISRATELATVKYANHEWTNLR
jgi:lipoate-protein ligase A